MTNRTRNNERSLLLSNQENESIFNVLGRGCVTLATAVVQLFLADSGNKQIWNMRSCGVVCFVKDNPKRSFFIRVYGIEDCQAGLNFASIDEADTFKTVVQQKLLDRQNKRLQKRKQQDGGNHILPPTPQGNIVLNSGPPLTSGNISLSKQVVNRTKSSEKGKGKGKKKLTKADISTPTDFRHVGHVGWDPTSGLQMDKLDPEMKALFEEIGIDEQSHVDEETVNFIYDFVDKHGGLNAVREDLARRKPPPVPPPPTDRSHVPPVKSHIGKSSPLPSRPNFAAPKPPSRDQPPPPPDRLGKASAKPPPTPSRDGHHSSSPSRGIPPPPPNIPPPPSPPSFDAPPPPPIKPSGESRAPAPSSGRAGLLDAIVNFKGSALKPVEHDQAVEKPMTSSSETEGGIAAALMDALNRRKPAMQFSDDEDENSDDLDDDDEWDD
ncbi:actin nucleation-promoting factor WASL-like isoform X2 [Mercenaria mercenaria]|uniref:actin nucleation-promoting factor WASL-like isoform X2 n=1 Tax=Mercenaria mercenaria TaxID=6596 RepID=UPI00234F5A5D|nr:actin nucleation-promoting factor WASL-like isoform X2 [Mercenaria mercenaria]